MKYGIPIPSDSDLHTSVPVVLRIEYNSEERTKEQLALVMTGIPVNPLTRIRVHRLMTAIDQTLPVILKSHYEANTFSYRPRHIITFQ